MIPLKLQYRSTTRASSTTSISSELPCSHVEVQKGLEMRRKASDLTWMIKSLGQKINKVSLDMVPQKQCFSKQIRGLEDEFNTANESLMQIRKRADESVSQITRNKEDLQVISIMKEKVSLSQRLLFESASSLSRLAKCLPILIGNIQQCKIEYEDSIKKYYKACQKHRDLQPTLNQRNLVIKKKQEYRDSLRCEFRNKLVKNSVLRVNCNFSRENLQAKLKQINELEQSIDLKNQELEEEIKNTNSNILSLTSQIKSTETKVYSHILK